MKWVSDRTGRFAERPHYDPQELDSECEAIITAFLRARYGRVSYPITTNDLTVLLEQEVSDFDLYADLSEEGDDVEGVTDFVPDRTPKVRIDRRLSEQPRRENRLRTTLTHEFGHVKFHNFLWTDASKQMSLLGKDAVNSSPKCRRDSILNANPIDWMEWQAGYVSGAMLMPVTAIRNIAQEIISNHGRYAPLGVSSPAGRALIEKVQTAFHVSQDAARVRLAKLGLIADHPPTSLTLGI